MTKKNVYVKGYSYMRKGKRIKVKPHIRKKPTYDPIVKDNSYDWRERKDMEDFAYKQQKKGHRVFALGVGDSYLVGVSKKKKLTPKDFDRHFDRDFESTDIEEL